MYVLIGWLAKLPDNELGKLYAELDGKEHAAMMNRSFLNTSNSKRLFGQKNRCLAWHKAAVNTKLSSKDLPSE
jgi:ubiquinone biosynthesis protein Coq4